MKPSMIIKVGGMDIDVLRVPLNGEMFGDFSYINSRIRIEEQLTGPQLVDTVKHELNHAIWAIGNLKDKKEEEERVCSVMASVQTQIDRDNLHYLKWTIKNLTKS
tara:strand:+ start:954 stop:1268 length:315 start_codon:yes stop_codon:yes gene_type:complete